MRLIWKRLSVVLLLSLLLLLPIYSDVVLTEEEWAELEMIWTELEKLVEEQAQELEFLQIQLKEVSKEISVLQTCLKEADLSLIELEKENKKKIVMWSMGSLLVGGFLGVVLE